MSQKITFKNIVIAATSAILLIFLLLFFVLYLVSRKPVAAFYGIPENAQNGITSVLQQTHTRRNKKSVPYEIVTLNDAVDLKSALKSTKKPDILFINTGLNADYAASVSAAKKTGFGAEILDGMTTSIKASAPTAKGLITGVPLLIDNYEIDVQVEPFTKSGIDSVVVWNDMSRLAKKLKTPSIIPILFAAENDESLINFFGALVESTSGVQAWNSMVKKLTALSDSGKTTFSAYEELVNQMKQEDGELFKAATLVQSWKKEGFIPNNISQISFRDIYTYMSANLTPIAFMTLSQHRTIEYKTISKFSSIYYPSVNANAERYFTSPVILAVPLSRDKVARNSIRLLSNSMQTLLCSRTGLAPVQANCSTPDKQSDDVRYWVAASNKPLPALSDAAFTKKTERNAFASALRKLLK